MLNYGETKVTLISKLQSELSQRGTQTTRFDWPSFD